MEYKWTSPPTKNEDRLMHYFQSGTASPLAWREMAVCILNAQGEWGKELIPAILTEVALEQDEYDNIEP